MPSSSSSSSADPAPCHILIVAPSFVAQDANVNLLRHCLQEIEKKHAAFVLGDLHVIVKEQNENERRVLEDSLRRRSTLRDAQILIVGRMPIDTSLLNTLPKLRAIVKFGVGMDNILKNLTLNELRARGIRLLHESGQNASSVAQLAICLLLGLMQNVFFASNRLKNTYTWERPIGNLLLDKKIGIIGFGHIGKRVLEFLRPFQVDFFVNDLVPVDDSLMEISSRWKEYNGRLHAASKEEIYKICDCITIHVSLNPFSQSMIDATALSQMQSHSILINTSRGEVVDEEALYASLKNKQINAAASDVFTIEPFGKTVRQRKLLALSNFVATPHLGSRTEEAQKSMANSVITQLVHYITKEFITPYMRDEQK